MVRDLVRLVQGTRKDAGLNPGQLINLYYSVDSDLENVIKKQNKEIKEDVSAKKLEFKPKTKQKYLIEKQVNLDNKEIWFGIKK